MKGYYKGYSYMGWNPYHNRYTRFESLWAYEDWYREHFGEA